MTGAGSGIGKVVSQLFAKEGACILGVGFDARRTVSELPKSCSEHPHTAFDIDVSCEASVKSMMNEMMRSHKQPPTIAVNCAGITRDALLIKMSEMDFDQVLDVNLKGTFLISKHLTRLLVKERSTQTSSIINISSIVGKTGNVGQANYAASKAGVVGLTKSIAVEYASYGIRCNAVLPGFIRTAMTDKVPEKIKERFKLMIPMKCFGDAGDVAHACLYLAGDQSKYVTGSCIEVAGGLGI